MTRQSWKKVTFPFLVTVGLLNQDNVSNVSTENKVLTVPGACDVLKKVLQIKKEKNLSVSVVNLLT